MENDSEVLQVLTEFVRTELLHGEGGGLDAKTPLLELGVIESLNITSLLAYVERRFAVRIPDEALLPENFLDLQAITRMVLRYRSGT